MQNTGEYISYKRIIKIEYYQTTKKRELFSIRMIREGLRKMITCVQDIQEEVWFHQEHKPLKKKKNILGKGNDINVSMEKCISSVEYAVHIVRNVGVFFLNNKIFVWEICYSQTEEESWIPS